MRPHHEPQQREQPVLHHVRPRPSLDGQYTIWGRVVAGMEAVDRIKRGSGGNGVVQQPDRLISAKVAADLPAPGA
jgi:peptidylprolyl isomerase